MTKRHYEFLEPAPAFGVHADPTMLHCIADRCGKPILLLSQHAARRVVATIAVIPGDPEILAFKRPAAAFDAMELAGFPVALLVDNDDPGDPTMRPLALAALHLPLDPETATLTAIAHFED